MNYRKIIPAKLLAIALAALSYGSAHAQQTITNTLPTTYLYPLSVANTNAPGFIWNVAQVIPTSSGSISFAESELVGDEGTNFADPNAVNASAAASATVPSDPFLPISFSIPGVINMNISGTGGRIDLPGEDAGIVGAPGTESGSPDNNIAAEALTYLDLPQGLTTMGVRSDDGFQVQIAASNPGDRYSTNAVVVESYGAGRSASDSIITFNVAEAGLYATRLLYYQGGGGASVEWYTFPPAGSSNSFLGTLNTGTNAVLVGDVADGGLAAYQSITVSNKGSYVSSLSPAPGESGDSLFPTITATIINGSVPVKDITLSIDGTSVNATVDTTTNGAIVTYTVTNLLANIAPHTLVLDWNDNGTPMGVNSTFSSVPYVTLDAATIVTPDTTKPGFKFNIFANGADPFAGVSSSASMLGVQAGDSDFLDNTELGLNGLLPDGSGGFLPNMVTLANNNAATVAAPALGGPAAPAEYLITNTIALTSATLPGFPAQDGADPMHSEVLTYVTLPKGLTTFTLNIDGFYRAFMGSWDYTSGLQVGSIYRPASASAATSFAVLVPAAGTYPLRITVFNADGTPSESISATPPGATNSALLNDIAHGGLPAYYALSTPLKPYIRYASPRPVPHQMLYQNNRVLVRVQDGDSTFTDSSAAFNLDGSSVTVTNDRVGDVFEMTWTATTLQTPAEIHTGLFTGKDSAGNSISDQWTFQNLKAVYLPTASEGYYVPTNAVVIEDFSEYTDPTVFTNGSPTTDMVIGAPAGQWYKSPQPENPLVDVAPIWTNVPAGPTNWFVWNWDALESPSDASVFNLADSASQAYQNFLCVDLNTFNSLEHSSANTAPFEMINGQPLISLIFNPAQNILVAESDDRTGNLIQGQTQFAMSKRFDLSGVTNPVLAFASLKKQNQDDLGAVEYSIDGGATWAPVIYYLDGQQAFDSGDGEDLQINPDATVNMNGTWFHDLSAEVPIWYDSTGDLNDTSATAYAAGIAAPITQALAPFIAPRINDDNYSGMRVEVVRLPLAAHQSNVRLRIVQLGTCSWYFGIANIAIYDVPPSGAMVPTGIPSQVVVSGSELSITTSGGNINVTWTGTGTLQSASVLTGKATDWSAVTPAPTGNSYTAPIGSGALYFRLLN